MTSCFVEICSSKSLAKIIYLSPRSFVTASFRWYLLWLWGQWHGPFFTRRPCRLSATGSDESVLFRLKSVSTSCMWPQLRQIQLDDIICDHKFLPMLDQNKGIGQEPKFRTCRKWLAIPSIVGPPRLEVTEFLGLGLLVLKHTWSPRSTATQKLWCERFEKLVLGKETTGMWHPWLFLPHGKSDDVMM